MRGIGKCVIAAILFYLTICFAGCGEEKLVSQDQQRANCRNRDVNSIMKTDKGFYYSKKSLEPLNLYYYDAENGKSMYLCNKPECRHEGDEFCAATSDKYMVQETIMYSDSLYISAIEETETTYEYKLLRASLDGSSFSEVVTYFELDNIEVAPVYDWDTDQAVTIHRNKAFLPYRLENRNNQEIGVSGTAVYDLETGELTYLGEKQRELADWDFNFMGCGDYMYYVHEQKYKTRLNRYSYKDGSVEELNLEKGFQGDYAVYDENTIFYIKLQQELYKYTYDTKENTRIQHTEWNGYDFDFTDDSGRTHTGWVDGYNIYSVLSDGEYVYIPENSSNEHSVGGYSGASFTLIYSDSEKEEYIQEPRKAYLQVTMLDSDGNYINHVDVETEELIGYDEYFTLHILDDAVYIQTPFKVYECSKEDFVAGNANFKEAYSQDIGIRNIKEFEGWEE